jgi:hypothetical protein
MLTEPFSSDVTLAGTFDACLVAKCETECGLTCGALSQIAAPDAAPSCEACLETSECATTEECALDLDCQSYLLCRQNCVTGDCIGACAGPSGTDFFKSFWPLMYCQSACGVGDNWACVGHIQWQETSFLSLHLTVQLVDYNFMMGGAESGVTVSMCTGSDATCQRPVDREATDSQGYVTLTDPVIGDQNLGLDGFLDVSAADLYPTHFYWGFPLTAIHGLIAFPLPVVSQVDWSQTWNGLGPLAPDPALGVILAVPLDCFGSLAPGVTLAIAGSDAVPLYLSGANVINPSGTMAASNGIGVFIDVPPGAIDVIATPAGFAHPSSRVSVSVQAGILTVVGLAPTPDPSDADSAP